MKIKIRTPSIVLSLLLLSSPCFSQGEASLPFMLISPDAVSNGMGQASVANINDYPLAPATNPAHLGLMSRRQLFSTGFNRSLWLPSFNQEDLWYETSAINVGLNLKNQFGISPEISFGLGYSSIDLSLGTFYETTAEGPVPNDSFYAFESANQYSFGVGIDYWVLFSVGYTYKTIRSVLGVGQPEIDTYDFGTFLSVPVAGILSRLKGEPISFLSGIAPVFNLNVGLAENNLGDKLIAYIDTDQGDVLPRTARVGIGIDAGVDYPVNTFIWTPLMVRWTREVNDLLVRRFPAPVDSLGTPIGDPPPPEYQSGLGDIRFFDEVILGKSNPKTEGMTGWEFEFFEFLAVRGGRFLEDPDYGGRRFSTSGYGLRLTGLVKFLRWMEVAPGPEIALGFILNHCDLRYNHSKLSTDAYHHPLENTEFNSWSLFIMN